MIHLHFSYDITSSFHTWVPFFFNFKNFFDLKNLMKFSKYIYISKLVEVALEGNKN
jgi:hypothetical protein